MSKETPAILTKGLICGDIKTGLAMKRERLRQVQEARELKSRQASALMSTAAEVFFY